MNVSVSLKLRNKETKVVTRLKVEKKGIAVTAGQAFVAAIKGGLPKKETMEKGKDRAQLVIKVDSKQTVNQKYSGISLKALENVCIAMATK